MKKWILVSLWGMIISAVLASCGGDTAPAAGEPALGGDSSMGTGSVSAVVDRTPASGAVLSTNYQDALPIETQLAFGTMQLEETDLAVTMEQAGELLPYWRVLQTLSQSDSAAEAEIDAVNKQIQNGMTDEQIAAIAAMTLTEAKLQTMLEEGVIGFGRGFGQGAASGETGGGFRGGGLVGGQLGGGPGGGPGGLGGDPAAFETRQAELEASGESPISVLIGRASAGMVVRLLETKTGEAPTGGFGGFGAALTAASELSGLSEEELGAAMAEGQTLGEVLEANGISVAEAKTELMDALADVSLPEDQALESWIDGLLSGTLGAGRPTREQ